MSSNTAASSTSLKIANASAQTPSSAHFQTSLANSIDSVSQRRSGGSGSSGAGSSSRCRSTARNNQPLRKQHKGQRRARLSDEDAIAESAAMQSINSRKGQTSITHLMNFSLPPRPPLHQHHYHPQNHRHYRRNPTWGVGSGYHAIDKARYVHANYRFISRPDRDYHAQAVDADVHLDWDAVLQILASAETQSASCPICLSSPVASRMAKCGHIFCLSCLIRYMHSTDDVNPLPEKRARWKKCPICEDSIYISETRPVRWCVGNDASMLREGGDVLLKLLAREPGTTLALPRDAMESFNYQHDIPWYHIAGVMDYARFMKGGEDYMREQYDREIGQLQQLEREDELIFGEDTIWTQKAVSSICDAKDKLVGIGNPPKLSKQSSEKKIARSATISKPSPENASTPSASGDLSVGSPSQAHASALTEHFANMQLSDFGPPAPVPVHQVLHAKASHSLAQSNIYHFYHAMPNFFLSPLDIRILKTAFGTYSSFPSTLLPRVEHISTGHMVDDDLRKRAKYMAHLPYGCEVTFIECDWTDIITPSVLGRFSNEIEGRKRKNQEKEVREERQRMRAEMKEDDQRWAAARRKRPTAGGSTFSTSDVEPRDIGDLAAIASSPGDTSALSNTPPWPAPRTLSSFATLASPGTSPEAPRTVWGTAAVLPTSPRLDPVPRGGQVTDDGWLQDWERDLLDHGDPVGMVEASLSGERSSKPGTIAGCSKKKKGKKITLMSTNARRGA